MLWIRVGLLLLALAQRYVISTVAADASGNLYITVDDPTAFTRPWSAENPMTKTGGPIYEYACHEGNDSMETTLKGARAQEKAAPDSRRIQ